MNYSPERSNGHNYYNLETTKQVVLSTNQEYLQTILINAIAPSPNMLKMTHPIVRKDETERFVPWFWPDDELAQATDLRQNALNNTPEAVLQTSDNSPLVYAASQELLKLQSSYLSVHYPEIYELTENAQDEPQILNKVNNQLFDIIPKNEHPLSIAGRLVQEDICLVQKTSEQQFELVAGFLATPTKWAMADFIGGNLDEVHRNVSNYSVPVGGKRVSLKHTVDKALAEMKEYPEGQFARNNVFIKFDPSLALHKHLERRPKRAQLLKDLGNRTFLRSERETLTRLPWPNDNFRVFTIKPHVYTLEKIRSMQRGQELARAILTNSVLLEPLQEYDLVEPVCDYLTRAHKEIS